MLKTNKTIKYLSAGLPALFAPVVVFAQSAGLLPERPSILSGQLGDSSTTVTDIVLYIINLGLLIIGLIAVAFIIYGGFRYITSAGNDEIAEGAKKTIQNAIIGLIVAILSYVIVTVISNALIGRV